MMCKTMEVHVGRLSETGLCKMHKCPACPQDFTTQSLLRRHLTRSHQSLNLIGCPECFEMFKDPQELGKHLALHEADHPYKCSKCPQRFRASKNLKSHTLHVHSIHGKQFSCRECGMKFRWPSDLRRHELHHSNERPFACVQCPWKFKALRQLKRHVLCHSAMRPHLCNLCGKGFIDASSLKKHSRSHYDIRPFACLVCDFKFKTEYNLSSHLVTQHHFSPNVPVQSTFFKTEKENEILDGSINTVSKEPYVCVECGSSFKRKKCFLKHYSEHKRAGHYICHQCNMEFKKFNSYLTHVMDHPHNVTDSVTNFTDHENKGNISKGRCSLPPNVKETEKKKSIPYRCTECGQMFGKSDSLLYHLLRHLGRYE